MLSLFIGSFMLAEAMRASHLDRRFAVAVLGLGSITRGPGHLLLAVGAVTAGISLLVSNTATTAIMLPISRGLLASLGAAGDPTRSGIWLDVAGAVLIWLGLRLLCPLAGLA